jgi:hypothetical protein
MPADAVDLGTLDVLLEHAATAIRVQEILNAQAEKQGAGALRLSVAEMEFVSEWGLSRSRSTELALRVTPLNLSYRVSRHLTEAHDLRVTLTVLQVALPVGDAGS